MEPRAFVIMPFGRKKPTHDFGAHPAASLGVPALDFEQIYDRLLKPALQKAGYEVARADSSANAGDIRTDMFFELVTADLVVADISILNANVYYELGVRHGVCPRGVFIVNADLAQSVPFDVAPDRRFIYDASPFIDTEGAPVPVVDANLSHAVDSLAKTFHDATTVDRQTIGSPVYAHLPGLIPVDWEHIETSKAKYFKALRSDWMDCVKIAQANGYPGDILTLAGHAPTRMHEARLLYETAIALINLCRYAAAEKVLLEVIRLNPEHREAQFRLAVVAVHMESTTLAEHRLRKLLEQHRTDSRADEMLGQVFRSLWRVSWQTEKADGEPRREKARRACRLAISAIHSFARAHRRDPRAYFTGFNALMLAFVLQEIGIPESEISLGQVSQLWTTNHHDLKTLVRYTADGVQQQALEDGDYVEQFWCTATLAGLLLIDGDGKAALNKIHEACAIPAATSFQLQDLRDRLKLLVDLDVQTESTREALETVERTLIAKIGQCACRRVILWHGYGLDRPGQQVSRFPVDRAKDLSRQIGETLRGWSVGPNDLGICGGKTESDVIFAEVCLEMGARLRIMMREPVGSEVDQPLWPALASPDWHRRLQQLRMRDRKDKKEIWIDTDHLGPISVGDEDPSDVATRRHTQWLINTAKMEASQALRPGDAASEANTTTLHGMFLWDGGGGANDLNDSSAFATEVERFNGYQGEVTIVNLGAERSTEAPPQ